MSDHHIGHGLAAGTTHAAAGRARPRVHHCAGQTDRPDHLTHTFTRPLRTADLRRVRFHVLRHSATTPLLVQGSELGVIKGLLGHAHIGVYAHVRLRHQRDAIDTLSTALNGPAIKRPSGDGDEPPPCPALVR
ncbi:tyrosine-type recombinase/integrase [Streptomyces sp. PB17]|uniref:tyrosine-type recombinase/integrase n=1 Tax=Streptomyces sp. PB17 TaxID=3384158 RepID=UPI0038B625D2